MVFESSRSQPPSADRRGQAECPYGRNASRQHSQQLAKIATTGINTKKLKGRLFGPSV
jgi:hypothetical protein